MNSLNQFILNNKPLFFVSLSIFIGVLFIGIITLVLLGSKSQKTSPITSSSSPTPQVIFNGPTIIPKIQYEESSTKKMLDIVTNRPKISDADVKIRTQIIQSLGNKSGLLKQTDDYILEYIKSPDEFMSEILITDINKGKQETVDWLKSKGMSQAGICDLPLIFYLNWSTAQSLKGTNISFNPLPEGC